MKTGCFKLQTGCFMLINGRVFRPLSEHEDVMTCAWNGGESQRDTALLKWSKGGPSLGFFLAHSGVFNCMIIYLRALIYPLPLASNVG